VTADVGAHGNLSTQALRSSTSSPSINFDSEILSPLCYSLSARTVIHTSNSRISKVMKPSLFPFTFLPTTLLRSSLPHIFRCSSTDWIPLFYVYARRILPSYIAFVAVHRFQFRFPSSNFHLSTSLLSIVQQLRSSLRRPCPYISALSVMVSAPSFSCLISSSAMRSRSV